jgi:hypothetical protein
MEKYSIFFMTEGDGFSIELKPANEETGSIYLDLLSCFGEVEDGCLKLASEQQATLKLKSQISAFVDHHSKNQPILNRLKSKISSLPDDQYFLILQDIPSDTSAILKHEVYISALNEIGNTEGIADKFKKKMELYDKHSGDMLNKYDINAPRNDRRTIIGNIKKSSRCCRFCRKTEIEGATFKKVAHAIPEGLGNKNIILGDECDDCNEYFGNEIEPALIEYLDIYRVFLGVKGKSGTPKLKYKNGQMQNADGMPIVVSQNVEKVSDKEIKVRLDSSKKYTPVKLYKALCKITLSTIDEVHIPDLKKTIEWLNNSHAEEKCLPKVAVNVVHSGFSKEPQVVNYVRKIDSEDTPHIVSEFRIGSFVYVYAIPFSSKDSKDFSDSESYQTFWNTFNHYSGVGGWRFDCFDSTKEVVINNETIRMVQTDKA